MTSSLTTAMPPAAPTSPAPSSWELAKVAIDRAIATDGKTVLVLAFTAPVGDPLGWLALHQPVPSMYWRGRDGWEYAGIGAVHVMAGSGINAMRDTADQAARFLRERVVCEPTPLARKPRFYGGFAFDPQNSANAAWRDGGFGDAVLVFPEAVFARRSEQSYIYFSFEVTPRSTPESLIDRLALLNRSYWRGLDAVVPVGNSDWDFSSTSEPSEHVNWLAQSEDIIQQIRSGGLEKVVLARRQAVRAVSEAETVNPWPVVAALRNFDSACCQFGFQFSDRQAFLGASPERLFRLSGRQLESEAVAGTITRGRDEAEDHALGEQLMTSAKDQLEHRYVVDAVRDGLLGLAHEHRPGTESQLELARLRTLQHLRSIMSVDIRESVTVGEILATLHPTPATAGVPRESALTAIRQHEPDSRGWYAGPVGWIGADAAEFAVAIRSALLCGDQAWLYAGAGLVSGSIPENEWREIQDKLQAFRSAVSSQRQTP